MKIEYFLNDSAAYARVYRVSAMGGVQYYTGDNRFWALSTNFSRSKRPRNGEVDDFGRGPYKKISAKAARAELGNPANF